MSYLFLQRHLLVAQNHSIDPTARTPVLFFFRLMRASSTSFHTKTTSKCEQKATTTTPSNRSSARLLPLISACASRPRSSLSHPFPNRPMRPALHHDQFRMQQVPSIPGRRRATPGHSYGPCTTNPPWLMMMMGSKKKKHDEAITLLTSTSLSTHPPNTSTGWGNPPPRPRRARGLGKRRRGP
jgi:hypothetical protein